MKQEQPTDFFIGLKNAFLLTLPFYFLLYWLGFLAIPLYLLGSLVVAVCFVHGPKLVRTLWRRVHEVKNKSGGN